VLRRLPGRHLSKHLVALALSCDAILTPLTWAGTQGAFDAAASVRMSQTAAFTTPFTPRPGDTDDLPQPDYPRPPPKPEIVMTTSSQGSARLVTFNAGHGPRHSGSQRLPGFKAVSRSRIVTWESSFIRTTTWPHQSPSASRRQAESSPLRTIPSSSRNRTGGCWGSRVAMGRSVPTLGLWLRDGATWVPKFGLVPQPVGIVPRRMKRSPRPDLSSENQGDLSY